jgi:hypothetical protein
VQCDKRKEKDGLFVGVVDSLRSESSDVIGAKRTSAALAPDLAPLLLRLEGF